MMATAVRFMSNPIRWMISGYWFSTHSKNSPYSSISAANLRKPSTLIMDFGFPTIFVPNFATPDNGDYITPMFIPVADAYQQPKNLVPRIFTTNVPYHNQHVFNYSDTQVRSEGRAYYTPDHLSFGGIVGGNHYHQNPGLVGNQFFS